MIKSFNEFCDQINENLSLEFLAEEAGSENQTTEQFYETLINFAKAGEKIAEIKDYNPAVHGKVLKNIQLGLKFLGYPLEPIDMTGSLTPRTVLALKQFRKSSVSGEPIKSTTKNYVSDPNKQLKAVDMDYMYGGYR